MQLTCIICVFWSFSAPTHTLNAIGKSGLTIKILIIAKGITLICILACVKFGIYAIMVGTIITSCITFFITSYFVDKYINCSLKELVCDIGPTFLLSLIMAVAVYLINFSNFCIQIPLGILIYVIGSKLFKLDSFRYILLILKNFRRN